MQIHNPKRLMNLLIFVFSGWPWAFRRARSPNYFCAFPTLAHLHNPLPLTRTHRHDGKPGNPHQIPTSQLRVTLDGRQADFRLQPPYRTHGDHHRSRIFTMGIWPRPFDDFHFTHHRFYLPGGIEEDTITFANLPQVLTCQVIGYSAPNRAAIAFQLFEAVACWFFLE
jgi:hypothetical protein